MNAKVESKSFKGSTIVCLSYVTNKRLTLFERSFWLILGLGLFSAATFITYILHEELFNYPPITSLERRDYPTENIDFPGVAICNVNMISRRQSEILAEKIVNITNEPKEKIMRYIRMLGHFFDLNTNVQSEFLMAQQTLEKFYSGDQVKFTPYLMLNELQIPCDQLLKKCYWSNKEFDCTDMFLLQITYSGFCCTFNYMNKPDPRIFGEDFSPLLSEPLKAKSIGVDNGLILTINNDLDDYTYTTESSTGVKVILFKSHDFPDMTSGGVFEIYCPKGSDSFLSIRAYEIYSTPSIRYFPIQKRKCYFDDEVETIYGDYSYSNCLVQCRVYSMLALCGCVPFQTQAPEIYPVCSFQDIPCLSKYTVKWNTPFPFNSMDIEELSHEHEDSLACEQCYTSCADTVYQVDTNFNPVGDTNDSIIHLYFPNNYVELYKQDTKFYWFEILSFIGGLMGIMLGCSFMTLVEILKFLFDLILKRMGKKYGLNSTHPRN